MSGQPDINVMDSCCRNDKAVLCVCVRKESKQQYVCLSTKCRGLG